MPDYLTKRAGYWQFTRRVPKEFAALDKRGIIKHSTKVPVSRDRRGSRAAKIAANMNRKLEAFWRGLSEGRSQEAADPYADTRRRDYADTSELANRSILEVLERLEKLISEVFSKFENQTRNEVKNMSPNQLKRSKKDFKDKLVTNKQLANKQIAVQPIVPVLVDNLVMLGKAFADATGVKITTVGTNSTKTASFYVDLENGETSCTLRKYDNLTAWFASQNWPEGHTMPKLKDPRHYPNP